MNWWFVKGDGIINKALNGLYDAECGAPEQDTVMVKPWLEMVGVRGFEPPTSWSQTMRANRTAPHPATTILP